MLDWGKRDETSLYPLFICHSQNLVCSNDANGFEGLGMIGMLWRFKPQWDMEHLLNLFFKTPCFWEKHLLTILTLLRSICFRIGLRGWRPGSFARRTHKARKRQKEEEADPILDSLMTSGILRWSWSAFAMGFGFAIRVFVHFSWEVGVNL